MALRAVIHDTGVTEHRRRKGTGYVADTAILGGRNMADILLCRCPRSTIGMTFVAVINPSGVIKDAIGEITTRKTMAYATILGRVRMARCNGCLASCTCCNIIYTAIMARFTIPGDTCMSENMRRKGIICMAEVTILGRWQMTCRLHSRRRGREELTLMTTFTTRSHTRMDTRQKDRVCKTTRGGSVPVTLIALLLCRDMIDLFVYSDNAIVTGRADIRHIRIQVIKHPSGKVDEVGDDVTIRTVTDCRHVIPALPWSNVAVMAQRAIASVNAGVIEHRSDKRIGGVTVTTIIGGRYVIDVLARSDHTVVAACAEYWINHSRIMIKHSRDEGPWCMTGTTI